MKHVSKHVACLSIVATSGFFQACSSDKTAGAETGGAVGTDGADNASGPSNTGGASSSGDTPPENGGAIGQDCTTSSTLLAPSDGIIASFSDVDGGIEFVGRLLEYPFDTTAPKVSTAGGSLHITQNTPATSSAQNTGDAIGFWESIYSRAFNGVEFSISGSFSGCAMKYLTGDIVHQDATSGAPYAIGPVGAYQPQAPIAISQISSTAVTLKMPFHGPALNGNPNTPIDPSKIILIGWQFEIAASTAGPNCVADITLDDIKFY
jgi:hypothetical protein